MTRAFTHTAGDCLRQLSANSSGMKPYTAMPAGQSAGVLGHDRSVHSNRHACECRSFPAVRRFQGGCSCLPQQFVCWFRFRLAPVAGASHLPHPFGLSTPTNSVPVFPGCQQGVPAHRDAHGAQPKINLTSRWRQSPTQSTDCRGTSCLLPRRRSSRHRRSTRPSERQC